jgi:acyl-CoA thioester hydrolase
MYAHDTAFRVPYADTDQMGYMYYGNYSRYYEIARTETFRSLGIVYRELEEMGYMLPVYENYSKYLAPALYDEILTIRVLIKEMPEIRWTVEYEIYNQAQKLIHTGKTTLVFIRKEDRRMCKAPQEILDKVKLHF